MKLTPFSQRLVAQQVGIAGLRINIAGEPPRITQCEKYNDFSIVLIINLNLLYSYSLHLIM